jgi:GNAT superfamily N-acetyltransferase
MSTTKTRRVVAVREAGAEDLPRLVRLLDQLRADSSQPDRPPEELTEGHFEALRQMYSSLYCSLLVAEVDGQICGTCALTFIPNLNHAGRPWCVLENMVVDEGNRGAGIGKALIESAVAMARERNCYKISLTSNLKRDRAHRFYEAMGFTHSHRGYTILFD